MSSSACYIFLPFESNLLVNLGLWLDGSKQGHKNGQDHSEFETIIILVGATSSVTFPIVTNINPVKFS